MSITFLAAVQNDCVRGSGNSLRVRTGRFVAGRGGGGKECHDDFQGDSLQQRLVDVSDYQEYLNF